MSQILTDYFKSNIFILCKNVGCCLICCLRFCGLHFSRLFKTPKKFFSEIERMNGQHSLIDSDPCTVCLGILQHKILKMLKDKVTNDMKAVFYDCEMISFSLLTPLTVQIREKATFLYLLQELNFLTESIKYDMKTFISIKDVWKWLSTFLIEDFPDKQISDVRTEPILMVDVPIAYLSDEDECKQLLTDYNLRRTEIRLKHEESLISRKTLDSLLTIIDDAEFKQICTIPPEKPASYINIGNLIFKQSSIFVGGRYIKLSRRLCQTPWLIEGEFKIKTSVQQLICQRIIQLTQSEAHKFLSSGREDVDVRMLGSGRPFAVELINPKVIKLSTNQLDELRNSITNDNGLIRIKNDLKIVTKFNLRKLKEGEQVKTKVYRALCVSKMQINKHTIEKLEHLRNLKIIQYTPLRVLHRRALCPRERIIYEIRARFPTENEIKSFRKKLNNVPTKFNFIMLDVKSQAGTYIKEFVHGDCGRSFPNLCTILGQEIDIIALDVMDIDLEWP